MVRFAVSAPKRSEGGPIGMSNRKPEKERQELRSKVLHAAAELFLERGYSQSSTREIAAKAGVNVSAMNRAFGSKENILCELVKYVLEGQFRAAEKFLAGKTEDKILFYAAETTLQLYMAESCEQIRELYTTAYSMPATYDYICHAITEKLQVFFGELLPGLRARDFYELEIASGSIIRGYIMIKCDMYFPIEQKVRRFLETSLRIYRVPEEKILEAIEFVSRFDYPMIAQTTISNMLSYLEGNV